VLSRDAASYSVRSYSCCEPRALDGVELARDNWEPPRDFAVRPSGGFVLLAGGGDLEIYAPDGSKTSTIRFVGWQDSARHTRTAQTTDVERVATAIAPTASDSRLRVSFGAYIACFDLVSRRLSRPWRPAAAPGTDYAAVFSFTSAGDTVFTFQPADMRLARTIAPPC
jgi:hypothetical protein